MRQGLSTVVEGIKSFYGYLMSYVPTRLPNGMAEFTLWASSILVQSRVPNNDSTVFGLAAMVLHLGPTEDRKAKRYFIRALNTGAAKQIAAGIMEDLKNAQKERARLEAEELAKKNQIGSPTLTPGALNAQVDRNG